MTERFTCRANASQVNGIEGKLTGGYYFEYFLPVVLMPLTVFGFLIGELRVSRSKLIVGDITIDLIVVQVLHVGLIGKAGIGGHNGTSFIDVITDLQALETVFDGFGDRL